MAVSPSDDARFRRLFTAHRDALWAYFVRRLNSDEVPDAVAEVYLVAWRRVEDLPEGEEALLWLYGVARNVVRSFRRSAIRRNRLHERLVSTFEPGVYPSDVHSLRRAEDQQLLDAVSRLKPLEQELLRLRTWEDLSLAEIAQVVGISVRGVESRLARIRKRLRASLEAPRPLQAWLSPARRKEVNDEL